MLDKLTTLGLNTNYYNFDLIRIAKTCIKYGAIVTNRISNPFVLKYGKWWKSRILIRTVFIK